MSGTYGSYGDEEFEAKGRRRVASEKREKPLRKVLERQSIEEGEFQGFSSHDDLDRYCETLDWLNLKDEEASGDVEDLNLIEGVSYGVRW
jgi:hypothetical protein